MYILFLTILIVYTCIVYNNNILLFKTMMFLSSYLGFWNHSKLKSYRIQLFRYVNMCLHAYVCMHIDLYASITVCMCKIRCMCSKRIDTSTHVKYAEAYTHTHAYICMYVNI